jgi:hypothetical protein
MIFVSQVKESLWLTSLLILNGSKDSVLRGSPIFVDLLKLINTQATLSTSYQLRVEAFFTISTILVHQCDDIGSSHLDMLMNEQTMLALVEMVEKGETIT